MKNLVVFFVAVVGLAMAQTQINLEFEFFNRYGSIKAKQACYGMDAAAAQFQKVDAAVKKCFTKFSAPKLSSSSGVESLYSLVRKKRAYSIRYPSKTVYETAMYIQKEADYFRCVMTEYGITNSKNQLDVAGMTANVNSMNLPATLKKDLMYAVIECRKFALCVPDHKDAYPVPADVITTQQYLFCERELRTLACMKNDARYLVDQVNLKGTDGRLDFLQSDSEKVTALLFANAVVGPDDFGLYE